MIGKAIQVFGDRFLISIYRKSICATFRGLPLVSLRSGHADYLRIISLSFELLEKYDPKRLRRVLDHADWVVDATLPCGAFSGRYQWSRRTIEIDFEYRPEFGDGLHHAAYYAAVLVHEATHGYLKYRGIEATLENRIQIERICCSEENRFLKRINAARGGIGDALLSPFDPERWTAIWKAGPLTQLKWGVRRAMDRNKRNT